MGLTEIKLHPGLGAEVRGVDFARPPDTATTVELERLWREHHVLLFRGADITDEAQIRFSRAFGELEIHPEADQRSSRHPEIFRVANTEETGHIRSADDPVDVYLKIVEFWHTDSAYRPIPSLGAVLRAVAVPENGYERIRDFADPGHRKLTEEERAQVPAVTHSLTRRHPERDGRVSLYISPLNMEGIVGMTEAEGFALIDELTAWATQERFVYRHKWHEGDMLMWDNRCTIHQVMPYDRRSQRRTMHRTALVGREPVVPAEAA
jgi:taurine dioxygenase